MSVTGPGSSRVDRLEPPATTDSTTTATPAATTGAATPARSTAPGGRMAAAASISTRAAPADLGHGVSAADDGSLAPAGGGDPLEALNKLALEATGDANAFEKVTDKALLSKIGDKLAAAHGGLLGPAPDDATVLAWRQSRAAGLNLLEQAAVRAKALGDDALSKRLTEKLAGSIRAEPWRQVRDFAYESLVSRAEAKSLPAVKEAREALYPSKPPYDKWLADGKISIHMALDNDGSLIEDNVEFYKTIGFKAAKQPDGGYVLSKRGTGGKPAVEITIPALPKDGKEPALFDEMDNPKYDVIAYGGHAGHGQRIEHALEKGVKGTGEDKAILLMQCWGHGNVESLERQFPDAQMLSTTEMTSDDYDWDLMTRLIDGFQNKAGWEDMQKKTVSDLKSNFAEDITKGELNAEGHYFFPTTRSVLVQKVDRDGDGVADGGDHIFNVIYPKRVDAAGGYDAVVQPVPKYALDGTNLNQALNQVSLVVRYDHLLPADQERKLVWNADKWKTGGFFTPADGDTRAFQFAKNAAGDVEVKLSTRFAHTGKQELSRMMGYESGLWLADQAGIGGADKAALAVGMTQRVIAAQGGWVGGSGELLDEPWAEEELFAKRYGLQGFTFGQLDRLLGDSHDDFKPEHFAKIRDVVRGLPGAAALADRAPTSVGAAIPIPSEIKFLSSSGWTSVSQDAVQSAMRKLGVEGDVKSFSPNYLNQNQATNVTALVNKDGKTTVVSLGVDSEGVVRAAARLDMNHARKLDVTAAAVITGFPALPDGALGPGKADPQGFYDRERAAGKTPSQALIALVDALKDKVPAGSSAPSQWSFDYLERMGLISSTEVGQIRAAVHRTFGR